MKLKNPLYSIFTINLFLLNLLVLALVFTHINCQPLSEGETSEVEDVDCSDLTIQVVPASNIQRTSFRRNENTLNTFIFQFQNGKVETIKDEEFQIILRGPQPIQWDYEGVKNMENLALVPVVDKKVSRTGATGSGTCYTVRLIRRPDAQLEAMDTGLYSGRYVNNPGKKVSVYLYVPNKYPPFLLNTEHLVTVNWKEGKALVLPCLLNSPDKNVFLSKRKGLNEWEEVPSKLVNYEPRTGFTIKKLNDQSNLYGSYKCFTGLHNRNDTMFIYVDNEYF